MLKPTLTTNPVKIIKKPTFVNVIIATEPGIVNTPWGAQLNYQKNDVIISDGTGDKWCINREIYDNTYIDGTDWNTLYEKFVKNLNSGIAGIIFDNGIIDKLFFQLQKKFIKNNDATLIGMKKIISSNATIAESASSIQTTEGIVSFNQGDFIITGFANEKWPINREKIEKEYFYGSTNLEIINKFKAYLNLVTND